jgi:hypothetical protein
MATAAFANAADVMRLDAVTDRRGRPHSLACAQTRPAMIGGCNNVNKILKISLLDG